VDTLLQLVISGAAIGSAYGLIALGFLVIYHTTGVVNFAQGDIMMLGAVVTMLVLAAGQSYLLVLVALLATAIAAALLFRFGLLHPLMRRRAPEYSLVVGTIVFGLILQELVVLVVGDRSFGVASPLPNTPIRLGGVAILPQTILMVVVSWALVGLVWLFFTRTLTGIALRAVGVNRTGAAVSGVRVGRLIMLGIVLSVVITVIAGMLVAPTLGASPRMGLELAVKGFAAAVMGGFGSVYRAMIAGVVLGVVELLGSYYISSAYSPLIAYAFLLVALFVQSGRGLSRRARKRRRVAAEVSA
jgi:branched-chain amino acid transport system permease protein